MTEIAERFARDTATHQMIVALDDGLYRHVSFRRPGTTLYRFDLITWPGHLTVTGDCGTYVFARTADMFGFFRGKDRGWINAGYWAEKLRAPEPAAAKRYDVDVLRRLVHEHVAEDIRDGRAPRGIGRAVREDIYEAPESLDESGAHALLRRFEYQGYRFSDTWEWDLTDWDWQYLWCCHAIAWGITQYDKQKVPADA